MNVSGRLVIQALVWALIVIELEVSAQTRRQSRSRFIVIQINVFVLDTAPQSLDEDVIEHTPATIHADLDVMVLQLAGELVGGELHPLIGVEDFWLSDVKPDLLPQDILDAVHAHKQAA